MATTDEVEALKQKWLSKPSFELGSLASPEVGNRFAPFQQELQAFQEKTELAWAQVAAVQQHVLDNQPLGGPSTQTDEATYRHILAREALERYLHLVTPQLPDVVREELGEFITSLVETAVRYTLVENRKSYTELATTRGAVIHINENKNTE